MGMPAAGKTAQLTGIDISRLADGKIVETWHQEDIAGLMQQLDRASTGHVWITIWTQSLS